MNIETQKPQTNPQEVARPSIKKSLTPKKRPWLIVTLTVLFFLFLGTTIFFVYQNHQLKQQIRTVQSSKSQDEVGHLEVPTSTSTDSPTEGWKTYNSTGGYFEIKYPQNWNIYFWEPSHLGDRECISIGDLEVDQFSPLHAVDTETLKVSNSIQVCYYPDYEMEESFNYTNGPGGNDTIEKIVINGYSGIRGKQGSIITGEEERVDVQDPNGGFISFVLQTGGVDTFNKILSTLRFAGDTNPLKDVNIESGSIISSPFTIIGEIDSSYIFEGTFPIALKDEGGDTIANAVASQAPPSNWTTDGYVKFSAVLTFSTDAKSGTVVLSNDNPSGLPENQREYAIPVNFE